MSQTHPGTGSHPWRLNPPQNRAPRLPREAESRVMKIIKKSGNEAKKWLKTKDINFLSVADLAPFACKSAPIEACNEQKPYILRKPAETCKPQAEAGTMSSFRLHRTAGTPGEGSRRGGNVR